MVPAIIAGKPAAAAVSMIRKGLRKIYGASQKMLEPRRIVGMDDENTSLEPMFSITYSVRGEKRLAPGLQLRSARKPHARSDAGGRHEADLRHIQEIC
jgi:hypothetical protein